MKTLSFLFVCALGASFGAPHFAFADATAPPSAPENLITPQSVTDVYSSASGRKFPKIGVDVSAYFPTSSKTRRTFGSTWTSVGLGLGTSLVAKAKIYPDIRFFKESKNNDDLFAVAAGARYLVPLGKIIDPVTPPNFAPYAGFGLNLLYAKIDAPSTNTDDKSFGIGANAAIGTTLGRTFFVEGRYSLFSSAADFNLSGAQLMVGARF